MGDDTLRKAFFDLRGGWNSKDTGPALAASGREFRTLDNWSLSRSGGLKKRAGMTRYADASFPLDGGSAIKGLFDAKFITGEQYLVAITTSGKLYTVVAGSGVATERATGLATARIWTGLMYAGTTLVLMANQAAGAYAPRRLTIVAAVPTVAALGGTPPNGAFGAIHARKMFMAGDAADPLRVSWSATDNVQDWTTADNAGSLLVPVDYGQAVTGLFKWYGRIVVFLEHEIGQITGTSGNPASANYFAYSPITSAFGCAAHRTIIDFGTSPGFVSYRGIHQIEGLAQGFADVADKYLSAKIAPTFKTLALAQLQNSHAVNVRSEEVYALALPDAGGVEPSVWFMRDYYHNAWWRMRSRLAITFPCQTIYRAGNVDEWYAGGSDGHIYKQLQGNHDNGTIVEAMLTWITGLDDLALVKAWRHLFLTGSYNPNVSHQVNYDFDFAGAGTGSATLTMDLSDPSASFPGIGDFEIGVSAIGPPEAVMVGTDLEGGPSQFLTVQLQNLTQDAEVNVDGWTIYADPARKVPARS